LAGLIFGSATWALAGSEYRDFGSLWASGDAANRGENPYGVYEHTFRVGGPDGPPAPNLNPPASVYPLQLLAKLDIRTALNIWQYGSIALYAATIVAVVGGMQPWGHRWQNLLFAGWALSLGGFWHTIELGQVYVLLAALAAGAWLSLRSERPLLAAMFLGLLAALKPNFIVWPLLLALSGQRRSGLLGLAIFAAVSAVPLFIDGLWIYREWMSTTPSLADAAAGMAKIGGNSSLLALTGRFGVAPLGIALSGLLTLTMAWIAYRRFVPPLHLSALALVTTLLLGPVAWAGYSIVLLPVFAWMRWRAATFVAAACLSVPYWLVMQAGDIATVHRQLVESVYAAGLLLVLGSLLLPVLQRVRLGAAVRKRRHAGGLKTRRRPLQDASA